MITTCHDKCYVTSQSKVGDLTELVGSGNSNLASPFFTWVISEIGVSFHFVYFES